MRTPKLLVLEELDALGDQVERATSGLRPLPQVFRCYALAALDEALESEGPFDLIIAGPSVMTDIGLRRLRHVRVQRPSTSLVLAFDHWRARSLRETVRTGALDILRLPVTDEVIVDAVEQALEMGRNSVVADRPEASAARQEAGGVIAVVSATGGCGKTFFSTNLAYYLQSKYGQQTCLVDLDLQFGELSTALRLKPKYTITDLLGREGKGDGDMAASLHDYLAVHETGIRVLPAPNGPAEADGVEASDVTQVITAVRSAFDFAIVDTPAMLSEAVIEAIEGADVIYAIATLDLPSVRNLRVLLSTFEQLKIPSEHVHLVLNKVEPDVGMDVPQVSKYFSQGFSIVVPYGREVNRSLNMGMPMLAYAPRSEVSKVLEAGLASTLPLDVLGGKDGLKEAPAKSPRRLFARWRQAPVGA